MIPTVPLTDGQYEKLLLALESVAEKVKGLESTARILKWVTVAAVVAGLVGIVVAVGGARSLHSFQQDIAERSVNSCIQFNAQAERSREGAVAVAVAVLEAAAKDPHHPSSQELVIRDRATQSASAAAAESYPYRDCSPDGLDQYRHTTISDPAVTTTSAP